MISTELRLTWMQRVRPDLLGSHLEAYIKLLPTFNSLRLCARYGKGDSAFINRLPSELVTQIEESLTAQEHYDNDIPIWSFPSLCFFGVCDPIDHLYSDQELVRLYAHYVQGTKIDDAATSTAKLNVDEKMELSAIMMEDNQIDDEVLPGISYWQAIHEDMRSQWTYLTGEVGSHGNGVLQKHRTLFRRLFGLDFSISHKTYEMKWYHEDFSSATETFIMLPSARAVQHLPPRLAGEEINARLPTEHTSSFAIVPPPQPSEKSMARFARCLKVLQLEPLPLFGRRDLVDGSKATNESKKDEASDEESDGSGSAASTSDSGEAEEEEGSGRSTGPALRLLVVNRDDTPYDVMD